MTPHMTVTFNIPSGVEDDALTENRIVRNFLTQTCDKDGHNALKLDLNHRHYSSVHFTVGLTEEMFVVILATSFENDPMCDIENYT